MASFELPVGAARIVAPRRARRRIVAIGATGRGSAAHDRQDVPSLSAAIADAHQVQGYFDEVPLDRWSPTLCMRAYCELELALRTLLEVIGSTELGSLTR